MKIDQNQELPAMCMLDVLGDMRRAGNRLEQLRLREKAWEMLEIYRTPGGVMGTRLSNEWLGEKGWRVQLVPHIALVDADTMEVFAPLINALRRRQVDDALGTFVSVPTMEMPTAVWRVPMESDRLSAFFEAHRYDFHLLFPEDRSFAIHANDGDFATFAGSDSFLKEALPEEFLGSAATADLKGAMEHDYGVGCMDTILAHYDPFLLEG